MSPPPLPPPARPRRATMTAPHPGAPRPRRRRLGQWTAFVLHDIADEDDEEDEAEDARGEVVCEQGEEAVVLEIVAGRSEDG